MHYSENIVPLTLQEKRKEIIMLVVAVFLPLILAGVGYALSFVEFVWAVFFWIAAGMTLIMVSIRNFIRAFKDDFFSHKIIYNGIVQDVRIVKIGYSTSSSNLYEFVLEKKTLKLAEGSFVATKVVDVPLPSKGEVVEIHALPKSGNIIKLLIQRNGKWESVALM